MADQPDFNLGTSSQLTGTGDQSRPIQAPTSSRTPGRPIADGADGESEIHLLDLVRVLVKRRWTAGAAFLVVLLAVALHVMTATPIYEGRARLLIESERPNVVAFKEVIEQDQATDAYYQTQYKLLEGRALARKTLDTLKLWDRPDFNPARRPRPSGVLAAVGNGAQWLSTSARSLFSQTPARMAQPTDGETPEQSQAIDAYLERLVVSPIRFSRLVDVKFRWPDPVLAATIANTHARGYIDQDLEFKFLSSKEASDWLYRRLEEQRQNVKSSEEAVQQYREQNDAVSLEERQDIVVQKLSDINSAVTRAKTERIEKETLFRQIQTIGNNSGALDTFPSVLANPFIQQLKAQLADLQRQQAQLSDRLGERHPDMIKVKTEIETADAKLQAEVAKVVQSVHADYLAAAAREQSLVEALDSQKREALSMNQKGIQGNVLKRDADSNRQLYEGLLQRAKETEVSGALKTSNIRLVDLAEAPRVPISPNKSTAFLLALLGGGLFAMSLAFFFEYLDDRIKTPDDIRTHLGLSTIGLVPKVAPELLGAHPLISNGVPLNFAEAFRTVRTSVLFSSADVHHRTVVVTSTSPGEGKSLTSANLAVGIAQAGERVLLIDSDMRRASVHGLFDIEQEPGLSNLLVGNAPTRDAVRASGVTGLWVLPAGRVPPNPAELLASQRFKDFLLAIGQQFDWVIIDSPPVLAVTDATIVGHLAHGIVFVVGAEMTSRRAASTAVERLDRAGGRFIGAVLNHVQVERNSYYYSPYYGRQYDNYYVKPAAS